MIDAGADFEDNATEQSEQAGGVELMDGVRVAWGILVADDAKAVS